MRRRLYAPQTSQNGVLICFNRSLRARESRCDIIVGIKIIKYTQLGGDLCFKKTEKKKPYTGGRRRCLPLPAVGNPHPLFCHSENTPNLRHDNGRRRHFCVIIIIIIMSSP